MRKVYAAVGADDGRLAHDVFDGEHRWDPAPAEAFLDRWLPLGPAGAGAAV